jgi:hypothetical protein
MLGIFVKHNYLSNKPAHLTNIGQIDSSTISEELEFEIQIDPLEEHHQK